MQVQIYIGESATDLAVGTKVAHPIGSLAGTQGYSIEAGGRVQVAHAVRGDGTVVEINWCDLRDKPYLVQFSTGEVRSACVRACA